MNNQQQASMKTGKIGRIRGIKGSGGFFESYCKNWDKIGGGKFRDKPEEKKDKKKLSRKNLDS